MEFVDEALFAQKRGDETTAQLFYQKAYNLERRYALSIPKEESYQLSRSVFLRSAVISLEGNQQLNGIHVIHFNCCQSLRLLTKFRSIFAINLWTQIVTIWNWRLFYTHIFNHYF